MSILETERLILRVFVPNDWETLNAIVSNPVITQFMHFASWDQATAPNATTALPYTP